MNKDTGGAKPPFCDSYCGSNSRTLGLPRTQACKGPKFLLISWWKAVQMGNIFWLPECLCYLQLMGPNDSPSFPGDSYDIRFPLLSLSTTQSVGLAEVSSIKASTILSQSLPFQACWV